MVSVRAAAVEIDDGGSPGALNTAECEIVFVEFLGDLVKLHLTSGGERLLVKVPGEHYPSLRGREGERVRISLGGGGCPAPRRLNAATSSMTSPSSRRRSRSRATPRAERALGDVGGGKGGGWVTLAWGLPGFVWLGFYLVAPLVFIVLVSFWTRTDTGFVRHWTAANYGVLLHPFNLDNSYWKNMETSFVTSVIAVAACLVFGFPVAYFLAFKVQKLQNQIALFIIALAPFWTSFLTRSVAWAYPLMGREGALNQFLLKLHIVSQPVSAFGFSTLSVRLAMIQLYILFMVTPLFFLLGQVDRSRARGGAGSGRQLVGGVPRGDPAADHARHRDRLDLHLRAHDGRVRHGHGDRAGRGLLRRHVHPAAGAGHPVPAGRRVPPCFLVIALLAGVFVITRFANLREEL